MSRWQEQLDSHPIWETIEEIKEHLNIEIEDADEDIFVEERRLSGIITQIEAVLKELDAETVPFGILNRFKDQLTDVWNQTHTYSDDQCIDYLHAANDHLTNALSDFSLLMSFSRISAQKPQLKGIKELSDDFASSLGKKTNELDESVQSVRTDTDEQIAKVAELGKSIDARSEQLDGLMESLKEEFNSQMNEFIEEGEDTRDKILELHEIVAGDSATLGYAKDAAEEGKIARIWRLFNIVFVISTATWLLFIILYAIESEGNAIPIPWSLYPLVASLTGVLLYGAIYSAQQSAQHRASEKKYRSLALRVAAFEPFVKSLEDEQRNALRRDIAATIFGDNEDEDSDSEKLMAPIDMVTNAVVKILNAAKK